MRLRLRVPGPAPLAGAALLCLLIGLLFLALQVRAIFSAQLQQEYVGLVLEAVERADTARATALSLQNTPASDTQRQAAYREARIELAGRLAALHALVSSSPMSAPSLPSAVLSPSAALGEASSALDSAYAWWRAERDRTSADVRERILSVSHTLIALSAIVFGVLITALGMYAKRNRQLLGISNEFEQASLHDAMTGLPNRRKLFAALEEAANALASGARGASRIAVLYIDLDGFKRVNDTHGHRIGDEFLIAVSRRFRQAVRGGDLVARIGGDEFALLVREFSSDGELAVIAQRIIACVAETDAQMGLSIVRASVGIASFPDRVDDYWRLVAAADDTMYTVKRNGKNGYAFASAPSA
ncbi:MULTISPECIES: GGDEF domain-containing protein [unclassified Caballeronia]|uniref:GGDEF domain-containing protein n=1 Tax=Caballeronia TaxID=1827195 RepID=UPI00025BBD21|nr:MULTISPECIES: GGDEF domain-containing protein [unclassified Caballeronia]EKS67734.1 diguanylate cyclase [Burkholderia sp. SJ98]MDR5787287.1 GGDEF domain-containing protein [Caballeronia sp. LP003]